MRRVLRLVSALLLIPTALALVFATTWSGAVYALGLATLACAGALSGRAVAQRLVGIGAGIVALVLVERLVTVGRGTTLAMHAGEDSGPRLVDRALDEADVSVAASRLVGLTSFGSDPDVLVLPREMRAAYARMRNEQGSIPSPVVATYLGLERPTAYDVIEIGDVARASGALVFLHGFGGSAALPCWIVSHAAARAGMATVCPAIRHVGDWWSAAGEATLRDVVTSLRARGQTRLVLAGLSNGGIGGSLLLARFPGVFRGFVAISGASGDAPTPEIPVLCVQGRRDAIIPPSIVEAYAARAGGHDVAVDAGHFALVVQEQVVVDAIARWLEDLPR